MKLTYGFEIEGQFRFSLMNKLLKNKSITDLKLKDDGSVNCCVVGYINKLDEKFEKVVNKFNQKGIDINYNRNLTLREITVGIFNNEKDLLNTLNDFNLNTYYHNDTCGLHLHIKPLSQELHDTLISYVFVKKLAFFIKRKFCEHCVNRITENRYCKLYTTIERTSAEFMKQEKRRIMRIHPSGTFEFRFLSPCEHKIDNIKKLLKFVRDIAPTLNNLNTNIVVNDEQITSNNQVNLGKIEKIKFNTKICV